MVKNALGGNGKQYEFCRLAFFEQGELHILFHEQFLRSQFSIHHRNGALQEKDSFENRWKLRSCELVTAIKFIVHLLLLLDIYNRFN